MMKFRLIVLLKVILQKAKQNRILSFYLLSFVLLIYSADLHTKKQELKPQKIAFKSSNWQQKEYFIDEEGLYKIKINGSKLSSRQIMQTYISEEAVLNKNASIKSKTFIPSTGEYLLTLNLLENDLITSLKGQSKIFLIYLNSDKNLSKPEIQITKLGPAKIQI